MVIPTYIYITYIYNAYIKFSSYFMKPLCLLRESNSKEVAAYGCDTANVYKEEGTSDRYDFFLFVNWMDIGSSKVQSFFSKRHLLMFEGGVSSISKIHLC